MTFQSYYNEFFRADLARVVAGAPALDKHGWTDVTLQPRDVSVANAAVREWDSGRAMSFAGALFLTVLADQVCYTHFSSAYPRFRALTLYPKWRGDCPGGCSGMLHPADAFMSVGSSPGRRLALSDDRLKLLPLDFEVVCEAEVRGFVSDHLPEIQPNEFWARCAAEFPFEPSGLLHGRLLRPRWIT